MWNTIKRLALGIGLIMAASAILLVSDRTRRKAAPSEPPRIALFQHSSQAILEDGVRGILQGLADAGFTDGSTISIQRYNAEGDSGTANTIAREIVSGEYSLVVTASTLSLQAMANANREGKTRHVFSLVSDPYGAGVGISREDHMKHPPYMTGYGSLQPVEKTFRLARESFPALRNVGVVWNPAESNSEANTRMAREICGELGIGLLEANADNSAAVAEAARSLVGRGVQALWVGGDLTVMTAIDGVIDAARNAHIPVFTSNAGAAERGALFDVGPDFHEIGRLAGELAARVLKGTDPATIPVENLVTERVVINETALANLTDPWRFPDELLRTASRPASGGGQKAALPLASPQPVSGALSRRWKVDILQYVSAVDVEDAERGIRKGLQDAGLVQERDYAVTVRNANGDMPTLSMIADAALTEGSDLLIALSSPTLQAALQRAGKVPIVFTYVANPMAAGAGRSANDHLPNVTGVSTLGPYEELLALIRECLPTARRLGTLFAPAEVNSVFNKDHVVALSGKYGFEIVALPVNSTAEVSDATLSLLAQGVDAICQIGSNLTTSAFASIAQPARQARVPLFGVLTSNLKDGAVVVAARDYYDGGHQAGLMAARIMRGESPAAIPFEALQSTRILVSSEVARGLGMTIPASVLARAAQENGRQ